MRKRLAIFGILALTLTASLDTSATIISLQAEAEADRATPIRTVTPPPAARRSLATMVESDIAGRERPRESWAARVTKPPVRKKRNDATLQTIMAEIAAENARNSGAESIDVDRWSARSAKTDSAERWSIVMPPRPMANSSADLNGPITTPWSDLSGLQSLSTSSQWLLSTTSNYFNAKKRSVIRTVTGREVERKKSPIQVTARTGKESKEEGSKIPAYVILLITIIALASLVMARRTS